MEKKNFQLELEKIIEKNKSENRVPTLLLHSCCGPCSSYVVTYLMEHFKVTVLYYNPSIYPEEEYQLRLSEQEKLLKELDIPLLEIGYDHQSFLDIINGLENEKEGGGRCIKCFEQRLLKTKEIAMKENFDYFCTTLTVSPHKNAAIINQVGNKIAEGENSVLWLPSDFKKKEGYKKSIELSHKYDLYRQEYCGCEFSIYK